MRERSPWRSGGTAQAAKPTHVALATARTSRETTKITTLLTPRIGRCTYGCMPRSDLQDLLDRAKAVKMTPDQEEEQRRSFAFGNTKIENDRITRETIDQAAEALEAKKRG